MGLEILIPIILVVVGIVLIVSVKTKQNPGGFDPLPPPNEATPPDLPVNPPDPASPTPGVMPIAPVMRPIPVPAGEGRRQITLYQYQRDKSVTFCPCCDGEMQPTETVCRICGQNKERR